MEIPASLLRQAKAAAAQRRVTLNDFFAGAIREKLQGRNTAAGEQRWRSAFGGLRHLRTETRRINRIINHEFGQID